VYCIITYKIVIKLGSKALYRYHPYDEGAYPFFDFARPGRWIAEVERHTYFQLPVTNLIDA